MVEIILLISILAIVLALLVTVIILGSRRSDTTAVNQAMQSFGETFQAEFRSQRTESGEQARQLREELNSRV